MPVVDLPLTFWWICRLLFAPSQHMARVWELPPIVRADLVGQSREIWRKHRVDKPLRMRSQYQG